MTMDIRSCTLEDISILQEIGRTTFAETFGADNTAEDLKKYLAEAYSEEKIYTELANPESDFFLAYDEQQLVGYLKLNRGKAQTEENGENALEVERIYLLNAHQGKGIGSSLLKKAEETAHVYGKKRIWLGVWEKNQQAINFYKRHGYQHSGEHHFYLGEDKQTDYIVSKNLDENKEREEVE